MMTSKLWGWILIFVGGQIALSAGWCGLFVAYFVGILGPTSDWDSFAIVLSGVVGLVGCVLFIVGLFLLPKGKKQGTRGTRVLGWVLFSVGMSIVAFGGGCSLLLIGAPAPVFVKLALLGIPFSLGAVPLTMGFLILRGAKED